MSPKRVWPSDEDKQDDMYDDPEECLSDGDATTQNAADLGMVGDVLLDILDELCQVRELLRQLMERGCLASPQTRQ